MATWCNVATADGAVFWRRRWKMAKAAKEAQDTLRND